MNNIRCQQAIVLSVLLALASCTPVNTTPTRVDEKTQAQLREIEKRLEAQSAAAARFEQTTTDALERKFNTIAHALDDLFSKLRTEVRSEVSGEKTAILDPATKGYWYVNTDKGILLF